MNILMVLHTFIPESYGGAEKQTLKLAKALKKKNINVNIVSPRLNKNSLKSEIIDGIKIDRLALKSAPNLGGKYILSFMLWFIKLSFFIFKNRKRIDVIHIIHGRLHALPAVLIANLLSIATVIKLGRSGYHFDLNSVKRKRIIGKIAFSLLIKFNTYWISNSYKITNDLLNQGIKRTNIIDIPNGVEIKKIKKESNEKVRFIYFGRLEHEKNCVELINAFATQKNKNNFKFDIYGDGKDFKNINDSILNNKLENKIFLHKPVDNIEEILPEFDVYITATISEGMSNSLLEAMSCGLVPITTNVSGVKELIKHEGNGFIYQINDKIKLIELVECVINLGQKKLEQIGKNAQSHVFKSFNIDRIAQEHIKLYSEIKIDCAHV